MIIVTAPLYMNAIYFDTQSHVQYSIFDTLIKTLTTTPSIFAIIGPACSNIANTLADISHILNIPLVSF